MTHANRFRLAVVPLFLYAALFAVLAIDVIARLLARAPHQETGNLLLLLFFELMRAVRVLFALTLVGLLLIRSVDRRDARALSLFVLFGVVAYAMLFSGGGYVGPFQEWLALTLLEAGVSRQALFVAFGYAAWASWLALAGLVRFAVLFPTPLTVESVESSGTDDRAGVMRSVPGAGLDIGAVFRRVVAWLLRRGWLEPLPVWLTAVVGAGLSIALRTSRVRWALWAFWLLSVAIAITGLRASHHVGTDEARRRLRWIGRGALAGLGLCIAAGVVGLFPGAWSAVGVFVLLTLAPGALLLGLGIGLLSGGGVRS